MSSCHGKNDGIAIDCHYVPWAGESLRLWGLIPIFIKAFLPRTNHSQYLFRRDIHLTNRMILCITDVNEVLVFTENVAEALWVVKLCFIVITINQADLTVSDLLIKLHCFFVH